MSFGFVPFGFVSPSTTCAATSMQKRSAPLASFNSHLTITRNCNSGGGNRNFNWILYSGVPARFGKGRGAKEIGRNLVSRERPEFGHSLEREWPSRAHFYAWTTKIRSQSGTRMKRGLGTILWAIDENTGTNLQAFYKHFYIGCLKTQKQQLHFVKKKISIFFIRAGHYVNRAGRKPVTWAQRPRKYA